MKTLKYKLMLKLRYKLITWLRLVDVWIEDEDNAAFLVSLYNKQRKPVRSKTKVRQWFNPNSVDVKSRQFVTPALPGQFPTIT